MMPQESLKVLIFTTEDWAGIARLPKALQEAGFRVATLSGNQSLLTKSGFIDQRFSLPDRRKGRAIYESLVKTMATWRPPLVIPGDDPAVQFLQRIATKVGSGKIRHQHDESVNTIAFSLGDSRYFLATSSKPHTQSVARDLGIKIPAGVLVRKLTDAMRFAGEHGYPVVLKQSVGYAGTGVRICSGPAELQVAFDELRRKFVLAKRLARTLLGDRLESYWFGEDSSLSAQVFVRGAPAMFNMVAMNGTLLAGFTAVKERISPPPAGPSSVIRFADRPDVASSASAFVRKVGYTGFGSFDFVLDHETGSATLLEFNARPTPVAHLGGYAGTDLCQALFASMGGSPDARQAERRRESVIALFPQEYLRDASSPYFSSAFHDVPSGDPDLLQAYCTRFGIDRESI